MTSTPPEFEDILAAKARIADHVVTTPLLNSPVLDDICEGQVLLKAESLQVMGAFKFRGAMNRLSMIPAAQRPAGVVACSSGNHAQGVAMAAKLLNMPATIVMPRDAPALKIDRTQRCGAHVVLYDRQNEDREAIATAIAAQSGATFVHPFDDPGVIAGQGTLGLELIEQAAARGCLPDQLLAPASGGGMIAGVALVLERRAPDCRIIAVEPDGFDDLARSLAAGRRVANEVMSGSICDALMAPMPGQLCFSILKRRKAQAIGVNDDAVRTAMAFAFNELKLVLEPGGAVGLAALLSGAVKLEGGTAAVVLSGGNFDPAEMRHVLSHRDD